MLQTTSQNQTTTDRETRSNNSVYETYTPRFVVAPDATFGLIFGYISSFGFDFTNKFGVTLSLEDILPREFTLIGSFSLDYLLNKNVSELNKIESLNALIIGLMMGYQFFSHFTLYVGGGIGVKFPSSDGWFTWKVNSGLRVQMGWFLTKFDISYNPIIGPALGFGLGIAFQ